MADLSPRDLALAEVTSMERAGWSDAEWPRVLQVAERAIDAYVRHGVRAALAPIEAASDGKSE